MQKRAPQVEPAHYDFERYDDLERWISYWYQIRAALRLSPARVLEIGPGSGVFRSYLQHAGVDVKSVDIDGSRKPDFVADVADLDHSLPASARFDVVCAFQVLEHLPFDQFEACLSGIARRAPHALISLPYRGQRARLSFWWGDTQLSVGHKFMLPWTLKRCEEHYWELGKGYSARRVTRIMEKYFDVVDRYFVKENPYHYLWVLASKSAPTSE
ncbi:MAG TPA: methyltransferase domain-containing protein [Kofleriaceae bacterium]|nr:methyltransferase domain-containing protein [Kofleriaceae bacterium]